MMRQEEVQHLKRSMLAVKENEATRMVKAGNFGAYEVVEEKDSDEEHYLVKFTSEACAIPLTMMELKQCQDTPRRELWLSRASAGTR